MPAYRLYFLDRYSGRIRAAENFHADDEAATEQVLQRGLGEPLELWCGARKVARFEAEPEIASGGRGAAE